MRNFRQAFAAVAGAVALLAAGAAVAVPAASAAPAVHAVAATRAAPSVPQHAAGRAMPAITSGTIYDDYGSGYGMFDALHGEDVITVSSGSSWQVRPVSGTSYYQICGYNELCIAWDPTTAAFVMASNSVNANTEFYNSSTEAISSVGCGHNITARSIASGANLFCNGGPADPENQWAHG